MTSAPSSHLLSLLRYVSGDYNDPGTFTAIKKALGSARRPAHYLAIPPSLFATVIKGLGAAGLAEHARVIVEKPFGRDLASARELNRVAQVGVPGRLDLPHRPLPREGGDHEYPLFPLRQFVPGADLEPQLRGQRPDHPVRGFRRGEPRRVLRNRRLPARRDPEPPLPDRRAAGHGAAGLSGLWSRAQRESQGLPGHAPSEARRPGARPVRRLPEGAERGEETPTSRRSAPCGFSSTRGAGRGCRGTCAPASAWPKRRPRSWWS